MSIHTHAEVIIIHSSLSIPICILLKGVQK